MQWQKFLVGATALFALAAHAAPENVNFSLHDWQLVCDNTRTCRAAGYHQDSDDMRVSVLLTRPAGPNAAVSGQLMLGSYGDEDQEFFRKLPKKLPLTMRINERNLGQVVVPQDSLTAALSAKQLAALLSSLAGNAMIEWSLGESRWKLSDRGAAAVLLKMDEFQGRLGTPGALIRKGKRSEESVRPSLPPLEIKPVAPIATRPDDQQLARHPALRKALIASSKSEEYCPDIQDGEQQEIAINRLTADKLLVSTRCWLAAYNFGYGYWVIEGKAPFQPQLVTIEGQEYSAGSISSSQKGRGLGDCWATDTWTWDGRSFVHTESSTSGMCKFMAPGGAWSLPQIIYTYK